MAIKSDAQRRAVAKYNAENYERLEVRVEKGLKEIIKKHAALYDSGSVNGFVNRAITETMQNDGAFCESLYQSYLADPEKDESYSLEECKEEWGLA